MITAASLDASYIRATVRHSVTILQPLPDGTYQPVYGQILGEMRSRGELHHYRVSIGNGMVLFVPPEWLHPDSRTAVIRAGLTIPDLPTGGMLPSRLGPSNSKSSEEQPASRTTAARLAG